MISIFSKNKKQTTPPADATKTSAWYKSIPVYPIVKSTFSFGILLALFSISANPYRLPERLYFFPKKVDHVQEMWVDSTYAAMSEDERIGQLLMIRAHSDKDRAYELAVLKQIKDYHVGGLCFFQGTPRHQAELTNEYQAAAKTPLMISMDAEWGLGMRLKKDCISFPKQLTLGAIRDNQLIYEMGREIGRQCRRLGVHVNFAPVADINNNAANPVINDRSFGENRENVVGKAFSYALGLQDEKVLACAKHFPGHGDTDTDSHLDLPVIKHSRKRLDSLEMYPFRRLFNQGIGSVMVAHLSVPALDDRERRPTTLSKKTIQGIIRNEMHFDGLIFTDAMEMKGVTKYFDPGQADVAALKAGNDVILLPENVTSTVKAIRNAIKSGDLTEARIEKSVKRILKAKYRLGLTKPQKVTVKNISKDLNTEKAKTLRRSLVENALTLVRDIDGIVPFRNLKDARIVTLSIGANQQTAFQKTADLYAKMDHFAVKKGMSAEKSENLLKTLAAYNVVLVSFHDLSRKPKSNFGIIKSDVNFLKKLSKSKPVLVAHFGNPYALRYFDGLPSVIQAFEETEEAQDLCAQAIFGARHFKGVLPITASNEAKFGDGLFVEHYQPRIRYDIPESVGMWSDSLKRIDDMVAEMIGKGAAPGCQVLVLKNNAVVWNKAYGHHTYLKEHPVKKSDLYDLASVTKVAATTLSVMRMVDEGKMNISSYMSDYLPELKTTNKAHLRVDEMMAHHAALKPWIPFYRKTLNERKRPDYQVYKPESDSLYDIPVAAKLYMNHNYVDTVYSMIAESGLRNKKNYRYSDLGMYLALKAVENVSDKKMNFLTEDAFYKPLGCATMQYNPWQAGLTLRCAPTEEDRYFRYTKVQGYVHDMGAGMLGGIGGHAGLFSNANDLAKVFQMLLNEGNYFGFQYLNPETVKKFTTRYHRSTRRAIGFDMKELNGRARKNICDEASSSAFGHLGFTGTCVWADPEHDLVFVFLSNRTYPNMRNNKLFKENYRPRLQSIVYQSIMPQNPN